MTEPNHTTNTDLLGLGAAIGHVADTVQVGVFIAAVTSPLWLLALLLARCGS